MDFSLDDTQRLALIVWLTEHDKACRFADPAKQGASGGRLTYSFTPTSLGTVTKVGCACGGECDLTDYSW